MLDVNIGKHVTVLVHPECYEALCKSTILTPPVHSNPNMFEATLDEVSDQYGVWITLDSSSTGDRGLKLMIPWAAIVAIAARGERAKEPIGFSS
jgi:hypothetical protein